MPGPTLTPPGGQPPGENGQAGNRTRHVSVLNPPDTPAYPGGTSGGGTPVWVWIVGLLLVIGAIAVLLLPRASTDTAKPQTSNTPAPPPAPAMAAPAPAPVPTRAAQPTQPPARHAVQAVTPTPATPPTAGPATDPATDPTATANDSPNGVDLQSLYATLLKRQAAMEAEQAPIWAADEWQTIMTVVSAGEAAFGKGDSDAAVRSYREAISRMEALPDQREERYRAAMQLGSTALGEAEGDIARNQFAIALAARPDDAAATQGLKRAQTIEEVVRLTLTASAHEQNEELRQALAGYQQASALDPLHEPASEGLERVSGVLSAMVYREQMGKLLAAIREGRLKEARTALQQARAAGGDTPELRDAERRIAEKGLGARLDGLRSQGQRQESAEQWGKARSTYQAALKLDPASSFAQDGLERVEETIALHEKLDHYLKRPQLLQGPAARKTAANLLLIANAQAARQPTLKTKSQQLRKLLNDAAAPIKVRLVSDGFTVVSVYRVERIGLFREYQLTLTPGRYTAVGKRDGYRDVRLEFELRAGEQPAPIRIVCEERI